MQPIRVGIARPDFIKMHFWVRKKNFIHSLDMNNLSFLQAGLLLAITGLANKGGVLTDSTCAHRALPMYVDVGAGNLLIQLRHPHMHFSVSLRGGQSEDEEKWAPPPRQSFTKEEWDAAEQQLSSDEADMDMLVRTSRFYRIRKPPSFALHFRICIAPFTVRISLTFSLALQGRFGDREGAPFGATQVDHGRVYRRHVSPLLHRERHVPTWRPWRGSLLCREIAAEIEELSSPFLCPYTLHCVAVGLVPSLGEVGGTEGRRDGGLDARAGSLEVETCARVLARVCASVWCVG
jgi:hypothetical protein